MNPALSYAISGAVVLLAGLLALRVLRKRPRRKPALAPARLSIPADCQGKRIGVLVVAYNAVTTLSTTLKRIPKEVWQHIEIAIFATPARTNLRTGHGYKTLFDVKKLTVIRNVKT